MQQMPAIDKCCQWSLLSLFNKVKEEITTVEAECKSVGRRLRNRWCWNEKRDWSCSKSNSTTWFWLVDSTPRNSGRQHPCVRSQTRTDHQIGELSTNGDNSEGRKKRQRGDGRKGRSVPRGKGKGKVTPKGPDEPSWLCGTQWIISCIQLVCSANPGRDGGTAITSGRIELKFLRCSRFREGFFVIDGALAIFFSNKTTIRYGSATIALLERRQAELVDPYSLAKFLSREGRSNIL